MISIPVLLGLMGTTAAYVAVNETANGRNKDDLVVTLNDVVASIPPIPQFRGRTRNLAGFTSNYTIGDAGITVDNYHLGPDIMWTSEKVTDMFMPKVYPTSEGNLTILKRDGTIEDSMMFVDDNQLAHPNVLWSSKKIYRTLPAVVIEDSTIDPYRTWSSDKLVLEFANTTSSLQPREDPSAAGNLAVFDDLGVAIDSGIKLEDTDAPSYNTLWSSQKMLDSLPIETNVDNTKIGKNLWSSDKIASELTALSNSAQHLVDPGSQGHIATFDATGAAADSGMVKNDALDPAPNVLWSSKKIMSAVPVLNDTSISTSSAWSSSQTSAALVTKIDRVLGVPNKLASFSTDGNIQSSGFEIDDSLQSLNNLWTSTKIAQFGNITYQKKVTPIHLNSIGVLDMAGQIQDSGMVVNDSLPASPDVLWSSAKVAALTNNNTTKAYVRGKFVGASLGMGLEGMIEGVTTDDVEMLWDQRDNLSFSAPRTGRYLVTALVFITDVNSNVNSLVQLAVLVNNVSTSSVISTFTSNVGGTTTSLFINDTLNLLNSAKVSFSLRNTTNGTINIDGTNSIFSITEL